MSTIAIIPARMGSSRFPGKPLALLHGMPMLGHVIMRTRMAKELDATYVATCDDCIASYCHSLGVPAIMTSAAHDRCTSRVAEALGYIEAAQGTAVDEIVLVQGDEPMLTPQMIDAALMPLRANPLINVVNLMADIHEYEEWYSSNTVKVVVNAAQEALYFSRAPIPATHAANVHMTSNTKVQRVQGAKKQVCIMPFRREFLLHFLALPETPLERLESIDMLRVLEHGYTVQMVNTMQRTQSVDTKQDLDLVHEYMHGDALMEQYLSPMGECTWQQ